MGIFDRMGKVISSNLNAMLDRAEDDKKLLELNLEEMGEQLKTGRQDVVAAVAAEKQLRKKADDLKAEVEKWEKRAELKLRKGTIAARAQQARSGGGTESLGARGGSSAFDNFRKMEEKIEGREQESLAMAEVEDAIGNGTDRRELEDNFRDLERGLGGKGGGTKK